MGPWVGLAWQAPWLGREELWGTEEDPCCGIAGAEAGGLPGRLIWGLDLWAGCGESWGTVMGFWSKGRMGRAPGAGQGQAGLSVTSGPGCWDCTLRTSNPRQTQPYPRVTPSVPLPSS